MKEFETTEPGAELEMLTELENLARLPRSEYDLKREDAALRLDLPRETLDDEVANLRSHIEKSTDGGQAALTLAPPPSTGFQANGYVKQYATLAPQHQKFLQDRAVLPEISCERGYR